MIFSVLPIPGGGETPRIVHREPTSYVAIRSTETMESIGTSFPRLMPKLMKWAAAHNVQKAGPEFIRFVYIDMAKELDIELGFPVSKPAKGDKEVVAGTIPGGDYVSLTHFGPYSGLVPPNGALQDWAKAHKLSFNMRKGTKGEEFVSRVEFYKTDPDHEPDASKWETEILYMIKPK